MIRARSDKTGFRNISPGRMTAFRGAVLSYGGDPFMLGLGRSLRHQDDALVLVRDGRIADVGPARRLTPRLPPGTRVHDIGPDRMILPGFIDAHTHYVQTHAIGLPGEGLLDWLKQGIYPAEAASFVPRTARALARVFLRETLRAGTTTAAVYAASAAATADIYFTEAQHLGARMIAGPVLMDRLAPAKLLRPVRAAMDDLHRLVRRWHGQDRLHVALTPRFAIACTPEMLEAVGDLRRRTPGLYIQSHISETREEVAQARRLFPRCRGYLDVYDHYGLLGPRTVLGHGVWLTEREWGRLHETRTALAHCPTANAFLGSGCFSLAEAKRRGREVRVGIGTDIGAGTTFSMLRVLQQAVLTARARGLALSAGQAFYLATRGGAQALDLEDRIGSVEPGREADLIVLDLKATPLLAERMRHCRDLEEALMLQILLGDERSVAETYVAGRRVYVREDREIRARSATGRKGTRA